MFEKEAEELFKKKPLGYEMKPELEIYTDGFKDGYNKANEWHYPSKGEYPKENKRYLCKIKAFVGGGISYECFDYDTKYNSFWKDASGDVIAWKEIMPPSEPMRSFDKEEQKNYTESISKVYKPTGVKLFDKESE